MKALSILVLLAVVLLGVFALGTSTATVLCSETVEACEEKSVLAGGTAIKAELKGGTATLVTSAGKVSCEQATLAGKTTASDESPLPLEVSTMSFGVCKLGSEKCTLTAINASYAGSLFAGKAGSGTLYVDEATETEKEEKAPGQKVSCGKALNCTYDTSEFALQLTAGKPSTLTATEAPLAGEGEACKEARLSVVYKMTEPHEGQVGAAQGSHTTALCQLNEPTCASPRAKGFALTAVKTQATTVTLQPVGRVITCVTSEIKAATEDDRANPLPVEVKSIEFIDCTTPPSHTCNVKAVETPYLETAMISGGGGSGKWIVHLRLTLDCAGAGVPTCEYEKPVSVVFTGGNPGKLALAAFANAKAPLAIPAACGLKARISAAYSLTQPAGAIYMTR